MAKPTFLRHESCCFGQESGAAGLEKVDTLEKVRSAAALDLQLCLQALRETHSLAESLVQVCLREDWFILVWGLFSFVSFARFGSASHVLTPCC